MRTHPAGLRNSKKVNVESENPKSFKASWNLSEVACVVPSGLEGLSISSGLGRFSCNGICSMGFALEHQIKSTSGIGVNGDVRRLLTLSQSPWWPVDQRAAISSNPLSPGMAVSKEVGQDPTEETRRCGSIDSWTKQAIITLLCRWGN